MIPPSFKFSFKKAKSEMEDNSETIKINIENGEPLIAILEFEMPTQAQYKVVDKIYKKVKFWAWDFYQDISIGFAKSNRRGR